MKSTILKAAIMASACLLYSATIHAQQNVPLQSGLDLNIKITSNNLTLEEATVKIYRNNKCISLLNNKLENDVNVKLDRDSYYKIDVVKAGYTSKSIVISTMMPEGCCDTKHDVSVSLDKKTGSNHSSSPVIGIYYDITTNTYIDVL